MKTLVLIGSFVVLGLLIAFLRRKFSPETLVNGYMDQEKAKELSPEVFEDEKKNK